jgi:type I restriction enzyme, S subunit
VSEGQLPEGWTLSSFGVLGTLHCGQSPRATAVNHDGRGFPYVSGPDQWANGRLKLNKWTDQPQRTVPPGCIFITVKGAGVGTTFPGVECVIGRDIYAYQPSTSVNARFAHFALDFDIRSLIDRAAGLIPGLSRNHILDQPLPLPPLAEQKRIVAKVEGLLARVNAARERLALVPAILKRFRQAVLAAACEGRLTEPWRVTQSDSGTNSKRELPSGWQRLELGRFVESMANGIYKPAQYYAEKGVPCLRMYNIQDGHLNFNNVKRMRLTPSETKAYELLPGDILVNRVNSRELVGKAGIVEPLAERTVFESKNIRVRLIHQQISARFVNLFLMTGSARTALSDSSKQTVGMATVNQPQLGALSLAVPPLPEQEEIVGRVEALFKLADAIEKRVSATTARAERLTQAILAKAFRGELVPTEAELAHREGRGYESARTLLERLRAESAGVDTKADRRQRRAIPESAPRRARAQVRRGA